MASLGLGVVAVLFFFSTALGLGAGLWNGYTGRTLRLRFYAWPFVVPLVLFVAIIYLLATFDYGSPSGPEFFVIFAGLFASTTVPYLGAGIGGFYLGKLRRSKVLSAREGSLEQR